MNAAPITAIALPLGAAAVAALGRRRTWLQRLVVLGALGVLLGLGVHLITQTSDGGAVTTVLGGTDARFRIPIVVDPLSALVVTVTAAVSLATVMTSALRDDDRHPLLLPVVLVLVGGAVGTFVTGDLFNLFVFFEVTLVASYVLLVIGGTPEEARAAGVYVVVNLIGSLVFLTGVALLYGATGSVNVAVLASRPETGEVAAVGETVVVVAFALKAALLPLGGWLRVAYPVAPRTVTPLFAGVLTTVGVVAMYRVLPLAFGAPGLHAAVLVAGLATAAGAALAAWAVPGQRQVVALIVMAQAGFMVVGVGLGGTDGVAAGIFFVVQDVVAKTAIFLVLAGRSERADRRGGSSPARLLVAVTVAIVVASLVGIPPTSGGVGKILLLTSLVDAGQPIAAAAFLLASLFVLLAGVRLWRQTVWERGEPVDPEPEPAPAPSRAWPQLAPALGLAVLLLVTGLQPAWLSDAADSAAALLTDPEAYAGQVLP